MLKAMVEKIDIFGLNLEESKVNIYAAPRLKTNVRLKTQPKEKIKLRNIIRPRLVSSYLLLNQGSKNSLKIASGLRTSQRSKLNNKLGLLQTSKLSTTASGFFFSSSSGNAITPLINTPKVPPIIPFITKKSGYDPNRRKKGKERKTRSRTFRYTATIKEAQLGIGGKLLR